MTKNEHKPPFISGEFLKNDHFVFGLIAGLLTPVIVFGLIAGINALLVKAEISVHYLDRMTHSLISLPGNLLLIRYYFVNLKFDKTGRGVLLITFVLVIVLFAYRESL